MVKNKQNQSQQSQPCFTLFVPVSLPPTFNENKSDPHDQADCNKRLSGQIAHRNNDQVSRVFKVNPCLSLTHSTFHFDAEQIM